MGKYKGQDIREVWDWRLSTGNPILFNDGETWVCRIFANDGSGVLAEHVSDIPTVKDGKRDPYDYEAVASIYEWLRSVRDNYARPDIEELKPKVAAINAKNLELAEQGAV